MAGALAFTPSANALAAPVVTTDYSFSYVSVGSNVVVSVPVTACYSMDCRYTSQILVKQTL